MYSQISLNLHIYRVDISLSEKDNLQLVPVILQLFPSDLFKKIWTHGRSVFFLKQIEQAKLKYSFSLLV